MLWQSGYVNINILYRNQYHLADVMKVTLKSLGKATKILVYYPDLDETLEYPDMDELFNSDRGIH